MNNSSAQVVGKPEVSSRVVVGNAVFSNKLPLCLIAGPCALESRSHGLEMASGIAEICASRAIEVVFKASFDKANRTSVNSARGMGMDQALPIFAEITESLGMPTTTDVHDASQCRSVAEAVTLLQIPAMLSRQTDLLSASGRWGQAVNIKKGQFMAPRDIHHAVDKVASGGCSSVMVTERGTSFGYNTLVNDMRALPVMGERGTPVIFDATHSVQQPGGMGDKSGGDRRFVPPLARAAVAVGIAGVFVETHPDPDNAPSDGPNMIPLTQLGDLLDSLIAIDKQIKSAQ